MTASRELDRKQFFQPIVETIGLTLELPASIWLTDEAGEALRIAAATGLPNDYIRNVVLRLNEPSVASEVIMTGEAIVVTDIASDDRWKYKAEAAALGLKSAMVVPLHEKKKVIGVLDVYTHEAREFSDSEKSLIESFATQVAVTQRRSLDLETLNKVSLLVSSELHSTDLLKRIMEAAQAVLDCQHVSVFLVERNGNLVLKATSQEGVARERFAPEEGLAGWVAQTGRSELVPDAARHPRFVPGISSKVTERSMLVVPILLKDRVMGVVSADMDGLGGFDEHDQMLLEALASQAAVAMHNAQLLEQATGQAAVLQRLHQIGEQLFSAEFSARGLKKVLRQVARSARNVLGADLVDVYQYVEPEDRYVLPPILEGKRRDPTVVKDEIFEDDVVVKVVKSGKSLYAPDAQTDSWLSSPFTVERPERPDKRFAVREGILSSAAVPLKAAGETVGAMFVSYRARQDFTSDQKKTIELFANQAAMAIYNARVLEQDRARIEALEALNKMGQRLSTIEVTRSGLKRLLRQVAQQAKKVLGADLVELYQYSPQHGDSVATHVSVGSRLSITKPIKVLPDDVLLKVLNQRTPLFATDARHTSILSDPFATNREGRPDQRFVFRERIVSTAAIPLRVGDNAVGVLFVNYRTPQRFQTEQRELAQLFANHAATALYNARQGERLRTLVEVGQALTSKIHLPHDEILNSTYEQARRLTGTRDMYIALYDGKSNTIRFGLAMEAGKRVEVGMGGWAPREADLEKRGKTEEVILTRKPILHRTLEESKKWYKEPGHAEFLGRVQPSYLGVPMVLGDRVLGVIAIYDWEREFAYDEQDKQVILSMASQAAIALDNASLYYDVNRQLERRIDDLDALIKVGQVLNSSVWPGELGQTETRILEAIYEQARRLTGTRDMYIALYDDKSNTIRFGLAMESGERVEVGMGGWAPREADLEKRGKTEEVILTRKPILHRTLEESKKWYKEPGHAEFLRRVALSWLGVPMVLGDRVLGVIAIYDWVREGAYDEQYLQIIRTMADQAAIALNNARLYEETLKLHDEVVATKQVAVLGTALAALQHRINNTFNIIVPNLTRLRKRVDMADEAIVEILDIIERNARYTSDIIARIQEPLREIEPQDVDANAVLSDVVGKAEELWQTEATRPMVEVTLDLDNAIPQIRVPIGQVAEVFRNLVDNAYRAMEMGGQLRVASYLEPDTICVRVQDTGPGIPPQVQQRLFDKPVPSKDPGRGAGLGLWLSRLVLQSIGGDVEIERSDSTGTTMLVQIPVPETGRKGVQL